MVSDVQSTSVNALPAPTPRLPRSIYLLSFGIFAMVTSEFQVSGMVPVMAGDLNVPIPHVGYLVSIYALAMAVGGPFLAITLVRVPPKVTLMVLFGIFIVGEALGALAGSYHSLVVARVLTGAASGAFYGVAIAIAVQLVSEQQRGWAISIVLAGVMVGTVLGLPLANVIGAHLGWRESFWMTVGLAVAAGALSIVGVPAVRTEAPTSLAGELSALRNPRLWAAFLSSLLIIGATFSGFTYFTPILQDVSHFSENWIAALLFAYGLATVVGNLLVGKLANNHGTETMLVGTGILLVAFCVFAIFADQQIIVVISLLCIGFVGVTMNPAMVSRVMNESNGRPFVNTCHTSAITSGIMIGSAIGGLFISAGWGLTAPLWSGALLALLAFLSILPLWIAQRQKLAVPNQG